MGLEVMSIQVVIGSSLTAVILIGARSAAIRQETIQTIDRADHQHASMALRCGSRSDPRGLDHLPNLHVADKAMSVSRQNGLWHRQGIRLGRRARVSWLILKEQL
jgi:hypothetical protein